MVLQVRIPPGSRYPYETPILAFRSSELPSSFLLDLTRKVGEAASQTSGPMLYDLYSTATDLARSLLPKYLSPGEDVPTGADDTDWDHLPEIETGLRSEFFDKTGIQITENPRDSHSSETMNDPNSQSKVYIPPGLRKPQDIQGRVSSSQQADDTGQDVRRKSRASGRSGTKMFRDSYEQLGSGGEECKVDVADVRQESERLKEEWEAWQKSRRDSELRGVRAKLPAYKFRSELLQAINGSFVTIVCGQTGCGKSTQVTFQLVELDTWQGLQWFFWDYFTYFSLSQVLCLHRCLNMCWRITSRGIREENAILYVHSPEGSQPSVWLIVYRRKEGRQLALL